MSDYILLLESDLLEQFREKTVISKFIEVIGRQLNELSSFFSALNTERMLETAVGKQLDGIGDIVNLSRKEARKATGGLIDYSIDENYRNALQHKIIRNTTNCSFRDLDSAIRLLFNGENPFTLRDAADHPATIIAEFNAVGDIARKALSYPIIHAGGVGLKMNMHKNDSFSYGCGFALIHSVSNVYECEEVTV